MDKINLPHDIILKAPDKSQLPSEQLHFLIEIPWDEKYLSEVPADLKDFFLTVLPYLHIRTTDVHTAICLGMLEEFIDGSGFSSLNRRVVGLSLILHDNGWSLLTQAEIAASLGVSGLILSDGAVGPKEKHAVFGAKRAADLLNVFSFQPPLSIDERELILKCVLYHDKPWEVAGSNLPAEVKILVDLDHIWSFTHENFWQDTVRKGISPEEYLNNLANDLDGYFVTDFGKQKAREMWEERKQEVFTQSHRETASS